MRAMLEAVPYDKRQGLLSSLAERDRTIKWPHLFAVAKMETGEEIEKALSEEDVQEITVKNPGAVEYVVISAGTIGLLAYMSIRFAGVSFAFILIIAGVFVGVPLLSFLAWRQISKGVRRRAKLALEKLPGTKEVKLILPAPVTYHLASALGAEGEVLALINRRAPRVEGSEVHSQTHTVGTVLISRDEDASEASERFEALLSELGSLEKAADTPYQKELLRHGLDEQHLLDAEAELRLRVEAAQERRQLNKGIVAAFNAQDRELRAADPDMDWREGELALDATVSEA